MIPVTTTFAALSGLLLAEAGTARIEYESVRKQSFVDWWQMPLLVLVCFAVLVFVIYMYRRDGAELRRGVAPILALLRIAAFVGLLLMWLDIHQRTEQKVIHNSRVIVLIDTSVSMGLTDTDSVTAGAAGNRIQQVVTELSDGQLLKQLRQVHDVVVYRFDRDKQRVQSLEKLPAKDAQPDKNAKPPAAIDWKAALAPNGAETRLGQALRDVIRDERGLPIAGLVLISDGGQNSGIDATGGIELAREAKIPVFTVGIGSTQQPQNARIADLVAPARAYPNDGFRVTAYLQAQGLAGKAATIELFSRKAGKATDGDPGKLEGKVSKDLPPNGELLTVPFDLTGIADIGRRTLQVRVSGIEKDSNPADNQQEADIEIVDRKTQVLLLAGGPSREYQFLRNQLRREKGVITHVLLESGTEGISQNADKILTQFPATFAELSEYDCIVCFDPDWRQLDAEQIAILDRWVAEESGGMVVIAGPVFTDQLAQTPTLAKVRNLYPVEFNKRFSLVEDSKVGGTTAWPLDFSREGTEAEFLWPADDAAASRQAWASFPGVYSFYHVRGAKPGATVYARFSDPDATVGVEQPVYMAGQISGSGRVFYLGSGEMWRLRAIDDNYFNQFYIKLIRHVSQGRLLRGSRFGSLLIERDRYLLGDTVSIKAQLTNPQHEPLVVASVPLEIAQPDGTVLTGKLLADKIHKGMYAGQFTALQEGTYRIELPSSESADEPLTKRIQVKVPNLERENPQLDEKLLTQIAERTQGAYFHGLRSTLGLDQKPSLAAQLKDRTEESYVAGVPDTPWQKEWMTWLLYGICGALALEWLLRRISRLA